MEIDDVIAHAVYDPVARHKRYIEKRILKGRQGVPKLGQGSRVIDANNSNSSLHVPTAATSAARQAASDARQIADIRGRLNALKAHLQELLAKKKQAATSSKSSKSSTSSSSSTKSGGGSSQPKTAKQKQAAKESLKKAQATRAKDQKATPDQKQPKTSLTLDEQITRTRAVIADVEGKLRTAIEQSRTQTASNGR